MEKYFKCPECKCKIRTVYCENCGDEIVINEIAEYKCDQLKMDPGSVHKLIDKDDVKTVRELEKFITEIYIEEVLRRT